MSKEEWKEREERVSAFERAIAGNDVPTVSRMLDSGFDYYKENIQPRTPNHALQRVVYERREEMFLLLKKHGIDFHAASYIEGYHAKLDSFEKDLAIAALQGELKAARQEITELARKVEKLEQVINPKPDKKPLFRPPANT